MKRDIKYIHSSSMDEVILERAAELVEMEVLEELSKYEGRASKISFEQNEILLNMAKEIDHFRKEDRKKRRWKVFSRVAAVLLVCCISVGGLTLESSEGLRKRFFTLIFNEEAGGVTFSKGEEELLSGWKEFWYPAYLPQGFELMYAEKQEHFLVFSDGSDRILRISEVDGDTIVSFDTDTQRIEEEKIGIYDGYYLYDEEHKRYSLFFGVNENENIYIRSEGFADKAELIKVAESMEYIER